MLSNINPQKETQKIINFIKEIVHRENFSKTVVACSGGIDSSLTLTLSVKALGEANVLALKLPFSSQSMILANLAISFAGIVPENIFEVNIQEAIAAIAGNLESVENDWNVRQGNILARVRMIYLYDLAKEKNTLVCGTENRSEYLLGYFTRFGDEAADLSPINHLYKTQVLSLANFLEIPQEIINATPSADLWPSQTDETELGFSYKDADPILYLFCDQKLKKEEIIEKGFDKSLVEAVITRVKANEFKHQVPYAL